MSKDADDIQKALDEYKRLVDAYLDGDEEARWSEVEAAYRRACQVVARIKARKRAA